MWFPQMHHIVVEKNENYLQSVWIGCTAPLIYVWHILFFVLALPAISVLGTAFFNLFRLFLFVPITGLTGNLSVKVRTQKEAVLDGIAEYERRRTESNDE